MKFRWRENPIVLQFLLGCLLFLFLSTLSYLIGLLQPSISGLALFANANSTRTAIALTSQALFGPFPTATGPTPTPSWTPSMTPTPTLTPRNTPTPTRVRYFINTSTPRTLVPQNSTFTNIPPAATQTAPRPTRTSSPPTQPPARATRTRNSPPVRPTRTRRHPPHVTKTPRRIIQAADCLYPDSCYDFVPDYALRHPEIDILGFIKNDT
jgi:hypothetical protein